ncbi:MAG TPA: aminotransferase class V-fold PLP-dependent enzyme, partial [Streptosporangiaceae bacterium]
MTTFSADPSYAQALDAADPLASFRDRFVQQDRDLIYLDGNSLGPLPVRTQARIAEVVDQDWGVGLVRSWEKWIQLPTEAGNMVGEHLVGAAPGQVLVCDSVTVNLYKLACAALDARPGRDVIVTDDDNFPTDRYVLEGIAAQRGLELRLIHTDLDDGVSEHAVTDALDERTALVCLSHVAYRSGALADMARLTELIHASGALALWDLSHSVGTVPVELDATGADQAVGCTYKNVNAGPGAPGVLYVRGAHQSQLRQPIWGWFSQRDQFEMGPRYDPAPGIDAFSTGTPNIIGAVAV